MSDSIVKSTDPNGLGALLKKMAPAMASALPRHMNADRMSRVALTALRTTPELALCTPASFLGSILQASQLGLEVNTPLGQAYLIPYKTTCQLIIGYQGMLDLARRSGLVSAIYAFAVYDGDEFRYELGLTPTVRHVPADVSHDAKALTHVYAVAKLKDGEPIFTVLTRAEVERFRSRSMAKNSGPWVTDYEAMALKTSVRRLFRWLPKSAEMAMSVALDESPEHGQSQLAIDQEVVALLQEHGVDTSESTVVENTTESPAPAPPEQDGRRIKLGKSPPQDPPGTNREPGQEG
jgi:recombination protein RecT